MNIKVRIMKKLLIIIIFLILAIPAYADEIYKAKVTLDYSCTSNNSCETFEICRYWGENDRYSTCTRYLTPLFSIREDIINTNYKIIVGLSEQDNEINKWNQSNTVIGVAVYNQPNFDINSINVKIIRNEAGFIFKNRDFGYLLKKDVQNIDDGYFFGFALKKLLHKVENTQNLNGFIYIYYSPGHLYKENTEDYSSIYNDIFSYEVTITD
jgi:hypothetical protein